MCVLVVRILFIGNPKQGKNVGGDERCKSRNNNNTYNEGKGGNNNSACSEGGGSSTYSEGGGGNNNNTYHKVEVVEKKQNVKLTKLKMGVDRHRLPNGNLQKFFNARVCSSCQVYLDDYHVNG